ncbi:unnamed protein product, partial [Protopolystoma xenopodis]
MGTWTASPPVAAATSNSAGVQLTAATVEGVRVKPRVSTVAPASGPTASGPKTPPASGQHTYVAYDVSQLDSVGQQTLNDSQVAVAVAYAYTVLPCHLGEAVSQANQDEPVHRPESRGCPTSCPPDGRQADKRSRPPLSRPSRSCEHLGSRRAVPMAPVSLPPFCRSHRSRSLEANPLALVNMPVEFAGHVSNETDVQKQTDIKASVGQEADQGRPSNRGKRSSNGYCFITALLADGEEVNKPTSNPGHGISLDNGAIGIGVDNNEAPPED